MLVYDIEIIKAPPIRGEAPIPGIEYCDGWDDHEGMGISVIGAYDSIDNRYRVFMKDNWDEFEALSRNRILVGFNSINFDDKVCRANGLRLATNWDLLAELRKVATPFYGQRYVSGLKLDALARANNLGAKTGRGDYAPVQWQRGEYGAVIDYCLQDVRLTYRLIRSAMRHGHIRDPRANSPNGGYLSPDTSMLGYWGNMQ